MFRNKIFIQIVFGLTFFFQQYSLTDASTKITSLGRVPSGYSIVQVSLQYSKDMRQITYAMLNDKKENFVKLNDSISRPYYAVSAGTPYFTPKRNHHVYIASTSKNNVFVVIDGKAGPVFDAVDALTFSPDESKFAYRAVKGNRQCIVVDHQPQPMFDGIPIKKNLLFSPDNEHIAYTAYYKEKDQCVLVLDGEERKPYKFIENVVFSPDSKQYAYAALIQKSGKNEAWRVVRNDQESDVYNKIFSIVFSPDSKRFAFVAMKGTHMALVSENQEILYDRVGVPVFSPDSRHLAYAFAKLNKWYVNFDGEDGPKIDALFLFYYSPDSSKFAYIAMNGKKHICYVNNEAGPKFDKIGPFVFSPDSKHYAYAAVNEKGSRIVVDGKEENIYTSVGDPRFTPDSKKLIHKAFLPTPYAWFTVLNGKKFARAFYSIDDYFISPDSNHLAFRGLIEHGKVVMMVDEKWHEEYQIIGTGFFSPDSKHIAYHAMKKIGDEEKWYLVVDGNQLQEEYGGFIKGTPIIFDSDNQFHTIALRSPGPEFFLVEVTIPNTWKIE
jgi:hypothetical protein